MAFPISPESLTTEWLSDVLGTRVTAFDVSPLGEGVGILGLVTRVTLEADNFAAPTLIAKFPSPSADNRGIADIYDMYYREYVFYTQVAPNVPVKAPACYHAEFNRDNNDFVLLLEDLTGYELGDQVAGCNAAQAKMMVEAMADLHSATWQPGPELDVGRHNSDAQIAGMVAGFGGGWPVVAEMFPEIVTPDVFDAFKGMPDKIRTIVDAFCEDPVCLAHGDMRLDNIFFASDHIAVVDYQAICRSAPEHDLAYFVTQSLADDVRSATDWVALYHARLVANGIDYDLDACRERFRYCALYLLCYAVVICSALDLANERGRALGETLLGNSVRSMAEFNTASLLESL